ncbi:hypothetical protein LCGC14_0756870 [marine sediment metagenome]|uniref:Uncharacterized protein n=1 Tax=marine sediment metagenome TaxID=412755 RepID=A0A0F9QM69_9ZZZZ
MSHLIEKKIEPEISIKLEEIIVLEEIQLKLFKKSKFNMKYLEERIPIEKVKGKIPYRNHGAF